MKVLLDECVPHLLRAHLAGHDVFTATYMGWGGIRNGRLLALAAADGFDALLTTDHNVEYQQNLANLPVAVVVLFAPTNDFLDLLVLVPQVLAVLDHLTPRAVTHVRGP